MLWYRFYTGVDPPLDRIERFAHDWMREHGDSFAAVCQWHYALQDGSTDAPRPPSRFISVLHFPRCMPTPAPYKAHIKYLERAGNFYTVYEDLLDRIAAEPREITPVGNVWPGVEGKLHRLSSDLNHVSRQLVHRMWFDALDDLIERRPDLADAVSRAYKKRPPSNSTR